MLRSSIDDFDRNLEDLAVLPHPKNALRPGFKMAAALCASYIGGSVNFAATAQTLGLQAGPLLAGAMAADNIAMAAYIGGEFGSTISLK